MSGKGAVGEGREEDRQADLAGRRAHYRIFRLDQGPEGPRREDGQLGLRRGGAEEGNTDAAIPQAQAAETGRFAGLEDVHAPVLRLALRGGGFLPNEPGLKLAV